MKLHAKTEAFCQEYLDYLPDADDTVRSFYEVFRIRNSTEVADEGTMLI